MDTKLLKEHSTSPATAGIDGVKIHTHHVARSMLPRSAQHGSKLYDVVFEEADSRAYCAMPRRECLISEAANDKTRHGTGNRG